MTDLSDIYQTKWPMAPTYAEPASDTPLGDTFTAAERAQRLGGNIVSEAAAREEAYDRRIEAVRQVTGVTLENPERLGYAQEARGHLREDMRNGDLSPIDESASVAPYRRRVFDRKVAELQAKHPELEFGGIDEEAQALSTEAQQNLARATNQPGNPILKFGAQMAGSAWGQRRDPLLLGTIFAGPSMAIGRTALAKIATEALGLGVFNAGLTGGEQYAIQDWLHKTGQPTGIGPAAQEMGGAFVGGVGLGVAGGVIGEALKAAFKTAWPAAARVLRGQPEPGDVKTATDALAPAPSPAPAQAVKIAASGDMVNFTHDGGGNLSMRQSGDRLVVQGVGVPSELRGQGQGLALYERAINYADENGLTFRSDNNVKPDAVRVYEALKKRGYQVTENSDYKPNATIAELKENPQWRFEVKPPARPMGPEDIVAGARSAFRAMQAGEDSLAADRILTEKPPDVPAELHDDLVAAALKRADDPEAPSPEAVAAIETEPERVQSHAVVVGGKTYTADTHLEAYNAALRENGGVDPGGSRRNLFMTTRGRLVDQAGALELSRAALGLDIAPELADRIEQANPRNPREAMAAADQALDDFGRRDGMAELAERMRVAREAQDEVTEAWRSDETRERPGDEDISSMVPMKDRNGNTVMRSERAVLSDGDIEDIHADLIRSCQNG